MAGWPSLFSGLREPPFCLSAAQARSAAYPLSRTAAQLRQSPAQSGNDLEGRTGMAGTF